MKIPNLAEEVQPRVMAGSLGQKAVVQQLKQRFGEQLKVISIAQVGKTTVDVEVEVNSKRLRLEVKTVNNLKQVRTAIYDTVMSLKSLGKSDPVIDKFVQSTTGSPSFNMWIRKARLKDALIGYPGQDGVNNITGKLPTGRTSRSPQYLNAARNRLEKRLVTSQINYFVIYHAPYQTAYFYHTGFGDNPIHAKPIPMPFSVMLDTYGNPHGDVDDPGSKHFAGVNRMRVALKATFKL